MNQDFCKNLRSICAEFGSISKISREIGINRQQFNRYVNGAGMPSEHTLRRIVRYFGLTEEDMLVEHSIFALNHLPKHSPSSGDPAEKMTDLFRDQARLLRNNLGFYHTHFLSPSWEGKIIRGLTRLHEENGYVIVSSFERATSEDGDKGHKARYEGLASKREYNIYLVEYEQVTGGSVIESILTHSHRQNVSYLFGMTLGVAWHKRSRPYASRIAWKKLDEVTDLKDALKACGAFPVGSRYIEPKVRNYLSGKTDITPESEAGSLLV